MAAGNMQRFTAEIIAYPDHHTLVLQQSHAAAARRISDPSGKGVSR